MLLASPPRALEVYEQTLDALRRLGPAAICLQNQDGGVGRAVVAAARAAGIRTIVIPPSLLYPKIYRLRLAAAEATPQFEDVEMPGGRDADIHRRLAQLLADVARESETAPDKDGTL